MTQRMFFKGLGASGIVGTLIISGIALKMLGISPEMATTAINAAI